MEQEIKLGMVIDDYKLPEKEIWWKKALDKVPKIRDNYDFLREEVHPGVSKDTTSLIRFYKRRAK